MLHGWIIYLVGRGGIGKFMVATHTASGNPEHEAADQVTCRDIAEIAERRGARRLAVRLTRAPEELVRRVATPERRLRLKGCDTEEVWLNARWQPFDPGWPQSITIDTSGLPAQQTAEQILDRIRVLEAKPQ